MKRAESHCPTHMNWYSDCKSRLEEKENEHDFGHGAGGGGTGIGRQSTVKLKKYYWSAKCKWEVELVEFEVKLEVQRVSPFELLSCYNGCS